MTHRFALPVPVGIDTSPEDGSVLELTRLWITPEGPAAMCRPAYEDPKAMGQVLAELAWHFAHAYEQLGGFSHADALTALRTGWVEGHEMADAELLKRTQG